MATADIIPLTDYTKVQCSHDECSKVNNKSQEQTRTNISTKQEQSTESSSSSLIPFVELESTRQARINSLSHWPHQSPRSQLMADAGWFSCNVSDRVICIYCNTICQQWSRKDDPIEVHIRLNPKCPFAIHLSSRTYSRQTINDNLPFKLDPIHSGMSEPSRREATFTSSNWTNESPSIESLVRAGFFCSSVSNTVTCFYCNGSLHKWSANDNPMIEHARWFPQCRYAKDLCGNELYEKIQASKKRLQTSDKQVQQPRPEDVNRFISSRIDLPIVQQLLSKYKLAVIKRCLEDQYRIKQDDFKTDNDFRMACLILQRQIDHIQGCSDKIIVPSANLPKSSHENLSTNNNNNTGECFICLTEQKQVACMPCGHLCACVPCGYALKSCPICREKIQSFMRINY